MQFHKSRSHTHTDSLCMRLASVQLNTAATPSVFVQGASIDFLTYRRCMHFLSVGMTVTLRAFVVNRIQSGGKDPYQLTCWLTRRWTSASMLVVFGQSVAMRQQDGASSLGLGSGNDCRDSSGMRPTRV
jgi:hypothetical protein